MLPFLCADIASPGISIVTQFLKWKRIDQVFLKLPLFYVWCRFGAGSEFGRDAREEARRKKYGIVSRKYRPEDQPWILKIGGKTGKKWVSRHAACIDCHVSENGHVGDPCTDKVGYFSDSLSLCSSLGTWDRVSYLYGMSSNNTFVNINVEIVTKLDRKCVMRTLVIRALHHILLGWLCHGGWYKQDI